MVFKYPLLFLSWAGKSFLNLIVKPIILRIISMRDGGSSSLPGGAY